MKLGASPPYCAGTPPGLSMWSSLKSLCGVYPVSEILMCLVEGQGLNPVCDVNASAVKAPQVVRQRPWETLKFSLQQFSMLSIPSGWESMQRACQHWSSQLELWLYLLFSLLVGQVTITQLLHLKVWYLVPSLSVAGLIGQWVPHRVFFEVTEVIFLAAECVAPVCSFLIVVFLWIWNAGRDGGLAWQGLTSPEVAGATIFAAFAPGTLAHLAQAVGQKTIPPSEAQVYCYIFRHLHTPSCICDQLQVFSILDT